jgi:uncharacterized integral membrane protein
MYGPWSIDGADLVEVWSYRGALTLVASPFAAGTLGQLGWLGGASEIIKQNGTLLAAVGAAGMGIALFQIHIYVTELKRTIQV